MRDLIEHYKTLLSENLFEGIMRQRRVFASYLKDPHKPGLRDARERADEKVKRRKIRLAYKADVRGVGEAIDKKRPFDDPNENKTRSFYARSSGYPREQEAKISRRLKDFSDALKTSRAKHRPENP